MLTGQIKSAEDIPEDDYRRTVPRFQPGAFEANLRLVDEVKKLADKKGVTPGQIAIGWLLALGRRPGMPTIIPIPGATTPERVKENAVEIELSEEDINEIERILSEFKPVGDRYNEYAMAMLDN